MDIKIGDTVRAKSRMETPACYYGCDLKVFGVKTYATGMTLVEVGLRRTPSRVQINARSLRIVK